MARMHYIVHLIVFLSSMLAACTSINDDKDPNEHDNGLISCEEDPLSDELELRLNNIIVPDSYWVSSHRFSRTKTNYEYFIVALVDNGSIAKEYVKGSEFKLSSEKELLPEIIASASMHDDNCRNINQTTKQNDCYHVIIEYSTYEKIQKNICFDSKNIISVTNIIEGRYGPSGFEWELIQETDNFDPEEYLERMS